MKKRIISLMLCLLMIGSALVGCSKGPDESNKGAYIKMYLTDMVYDLDPANAFNNESALKIVPLLFDNLFVLDDDGKVQKQLAESYKVIENENAKEYKMIITLGDGTWSDGIAVTANDVVYAWTRILDPENSFAAASLLFDIKNARAVKEGGGDNGFTIDDVAISAPNEKEVHIEFETAIDYDQFLINLTSYALVPLREEVVKRNGEDWAKKPATIVTSGPFKLRVAQYQDKYEKTENGEQGKLESLRNIVLERNNYYYRDTVEDPYDKTVKPYRIIIEYTTPDEIMKGYENGEIFYVGNIPLSVRNTYKDKATVTDALSTHTYVLNQNAVVRKYTGEDDLANLATNYVVYDSELEDGVDGDKIFAKPEVRKALSLAIDRTAIKNAVVFAKEATGLVPYGVFNTNSKKESFRTVGGDIIASSAKLDEAKALLAKAGVNPADYMFALSVSANDDVHMAIAAMVQKAWNTLGFHVALNAVEVAVNDDYFKPTDSYPTDIMDDIFLEAYRNGQFEVAAVDLCALSADPYSMLSAYAKGFSGEAMDMSTSDYVIPAHLTGYDNKEYNELIEKAFAQKDIAKRAEILHDAEKKLLDDMVVIPVIFNQNATLIRDDLSKVKYGYYGNSIMTKAKLKDYELYIPEEEK